MTQLDQNLQMKIASLQEAILNVHPSLPIILRDIHTLLKNDPANVTLLSEEEIGIIVSGLKKQTATEISATAMKQSSKSLKRPGIADEL
jgi:hypothetical protein